MSAADLLKVALDDAGPLRVEADVYGDLRIWDADYRDVMAHFGTADHRAALRLLGLLLAAAPHLSGLLEALAANVDPTAAARALRRAMTEAGEQL